MGAQAPICYRPSIRADDAAETSGIRQSLRSIRQQAPHGFRFAFDRLE
jgi:hypothetical protein